MPYLLIVASRAEEDVQACFRKLRRFSVQGAATWHAAFEAAVVELSRDAEAFAILPRRGSKTYPIRSKPFHTRHGKNYQLFYLIRGNEVHILRVWSPGQPPLRLKDLP